MTPQPTITRCKYSLAGAGEAPDVAMNANDVWYGLMERPEDHLREPRPRPRVLVIGAGSRGNAYSRAVQDSTNANVHSVAELVEFKRNQLGKRYIWKDGTPGRGQSFGHWRDFLVYEQNRRKRIADGASNVEPGVDAAFICTLDEQHAEIIINLAPLNLHILSEKPLATTLHDCLNIYASLLPHGPSSPPTSLFGIGHVLRYSPHNILLRRLLLDDRAIGDFNSIEHTEPVGWWHFAHSYVRGNWRREDTTAPSLLTKCCHDIDLLLWLLCSPADPTSDQAPHEPSTITSSGKLNYFRRIRKPVEAGDATNCLSCPVEATCMYSAKKIYMDRHLRQGKTDWPVKIVCPEIESIYQSSDPDGGPEAAEQRLLDALAEDYTKDTPDEEVKKRPWFGRCVWENDNDVCDDQTVVVTWEDEDEPPSNSAAPRRFAKSATLHMVASTQAQCTRRGVVYGTHGELSYDSSTITVHSFPSGTTQTYYPKQMPGGHGGGDDGLIVQFVKAVEAVQGGMEVREAQRSFVGCGVRDVVRAHAVVFAAEEARVGRKVVDWGSWWGREVEGTLANMGKKHGVETPEGESEVVGPQ